MQDLLKRIQEIKKSTFTAYQKIVSLKTDIKKVAVTTPTIYKDLLAQTETTNVMYTWLKSMAERKPRAAKKQETVTTETPGTVDTTVTSITIQTATEFLIAQGWKLGKDGALRPPKA